MDLWRFQLLIVNQVFLSDLEVLDAGYCQWVAASKTPNPHYLKYLARGSDSLSVLTCIGIMPHELLGIHRIMPQLLGIQRMPVYGNYFPLPPLTDLLCKVSCVWT